MQFYNRVQETKDIVKIMKDNKIGNKIILLYSPSGVGKSGLVQKLFDMEFRDYISLRVKISRSSPDTIENLCYINRLYKEISELAKNEKIQEIPTPEKHASKNLKGIFFFLYNFLKNKVGIESDNKLYESPEDQSITRKKDYLIHVLNTRTFFISIENIQNIDTQSIEILSDILKKVSNLRLILEYTTEIDNLESSSTSVVQFMEQLDLDKTNSYVECYQINKMEFNEAQKLAPSITSDLDLVRLREIYDKGHGNLQSLKHVTPDMRSKISPIKYSLEKLDSIEKYIVNIIYLNEGKMDLILLTQLVTDYKDQYLVITHQMVSDNLIQLEEKHIISKISTNVEIAHDSIILELEKQSHNPTLAAAYRLLINYYSVQKTQNTHDYSNINKLFMLYLKFHDESIISILDDIKKMIIQYKYPQQILSKLVYLRDKLSEKQNPNIKISDEISLTLLEVSYQMELGQFAQEALDTIYNPRNTLHRIYFVGLMALNSSDSEVHSKIKKLIEKERFGSRSRLVMELMLLSSMMESESLDESKAFAQKMLSVDSYKEYMEFSLLLRNYAELVELKESLIIYQYCLEVLGSFNRKDLQAQIYISIAMCHSYLGQLDSAKNDIKMAIELSEGLVKENMILNNSAVIDMLSGSFSEQVLKNLQDALLLTANQYESILVKCNILVWHTVNHNYEVAQKICTEIEESKYSNYNYEEFLHIVYTNLCFYYQQIDNSEYLVYSKKIESLEHLRGRNLNPYIVVTPYRIDFLGYWNIEVSRDLQNS